MRRATEGFEVAAAARGVTPEEVADAVVFLASDRSAYVAGTTLSVDGGQHP